MAARTGRNSVVKGCSPAQAVAYAVSLSSYCTKEEEPSRRLQALRRRGVRRAAKVDIPVSKALLKLFAQSNNPLSESLTFDFSLHE